MAEKVTKKNNKKETKVQNFAESSYLSVKHPNNIALLNIKVDVPAISICLISDTHEEVLHAWLEKIDLFVQQGTLELDISGSMKRIQIDNQILNTPFSNIFNTTSKDPNSNFLSFSINQSLEYSNISYFNKIDVSIENSEVNLDEAFLTHLIYNITDIVDFVNSSKEKQHVYKDYTNSQVALGDMFFVEKFNVSPANFLVSYRGCKIQAKTLDDKSLQKILRITSGFVFSKLIFYFVFIFIFVFILFLFLFYFYYFYILFFFLFFFFFFTGES